jgi:glycosyltransferase involved in cell wall biosynthesis
MKILFICDEYPPGKNGGIGTATQNLSRALVKAGHSIFVAGLYEPGFGGKDEENDEGVTVWRKRLPQDRFFKNNYSFFERLAKKTLIASGIYQKRVSKAVFDFNIFIASLIKQHGIDIVEWPDFCWYSKFLNADFTWPALSSPLIVKFHGTHSHLADKTAQPIHKTIYEIEKKHLQRADAFSAVSARTAEDYRKLYAVEENITILYNSVPVEKKETVKRKKQTVVFTGSFVKLKGIHILLEAWKLVHERYPGAILELYGKGRLPANFSLQSVYNYGFVAKSVIEAALRKATMAVFPSYTECFALAPMEAMANGCPVIYTNMGSGTELIQNGFNGLLVEPGNAQLLCNAICFLLDREALRNELAENAYKTITERFSMDISIPDHLACYEQTVSHFTVPPSLAVAGQKATSLPSIAYL